MTQLSPGIQLSEKNRSFTVQNLPSSITGSVLRAESGPAFTAIDISEEAELINVFGKPTDKNFKDWYNCSNFLRYASSLKVVRPIDANKEAKNAGIVLSGGDVYKLITFVAGTIGTLPVAGDIISQVLVTSGASPSTATAVVVSATDGASVDTIVVKNVQGTFETSAVTGANDVTISGTGTFAVPTTPTIIPTETNVQLSTYQGVEQGSLYNKDIATITLDSLVTDSITKTIGYYTSSWIGLTKLRGKQITAKTGADTTLQIVNASGTAKDIITFDVVPDATTVTLNETSIDSEAIWDGWGSLVATTLDVTEALSGTASQTITGDESGAVFTLSGVETASTSLSGTSVGVFKSGESLTLSGASWDGDTGVVATDSNQAIQGTLPWSADSVASGTDTISEPITVNRLTFYARYVQNTQDIGVTICSNATSWEHDLATDMSGVWRNYFDGVTPDFDNNEFAVIVWQKQSDNTYLNVEKFICSYDSTGEDNAGKSIYAETIFLEESDYLYCKVSSAPSGTDAVVNTGGDTMPLIHQSDYSSVYPRSTSDYVFPATYDGNGYASGDIDMAFDVMDDTESMIINILMAHESSINYASTIANSRKDCVAIVGPFDETQLVGKSSSEAVTYMVNKFGNTDVSSPIFTDYSTYSAVYGNMKKQYDAYGKKNRWLPIIGDVCGLIAQNDATLAPWEATAGTQNSAGVILNAIQLAYSPNKSGRDRLYVNGINPVLSIPGEGQAIIMGQKMTTSTASKLNRLPSRRTMLVIEQAILQATRPFLFRINNAQTRSLLKGIIDPYLSGIQSRGGITDFLSVIDATNNTPQIVDNNEMIVDIFVKLPGYAEFISLNFIVTRSDANFSEL